jgi:hypothetical protein
VSEPENIPERVTRLEYQVAEARKDAAAARILAGGADRDVSELRATLNGHTRVLNAIGETQREHGVRLNHLERKVDDGFAEMRAEMRDGFTGMREVYTKLNLGQAQITALLNVALNRPDET